MPLTTVALFCAGFVASVRPARRHAVGDQMLFGLVLGLLFAFVTQLAHSASLVFGFEPLVAVLAPMALVLVPSVYLLRREWRPRG